MEYREEERGETDRNVGIERQRHTDRQTNKETDRLKSRREREKQTERQTDRQNRHYGFGG